MGLLRKLIIFLTIGAAVGCYSAPKRENYQEMVREARQRIASMNEEIDDFNERAARVEERIKEEREKEAREIITRLLEIGEGLEKLGRDLNATKEHQRYIRILAEDPGETPKERFEHTLRLIEHYPYDFIRLKLGE